MHGGTAGMHRTAAMTSNMNACLSLKDPCTSSYSPLSLISLSHRRGNHHSSHHCSSHHYTEPPIPPLEWLLPETQWFVPETVTVSNCLFQLSSDFLNFFYFFAMSKMLSLSWFVCLSSCLWTRFKNNKAMHIPLRLEMVYILWIKVGHSVYLVMLTIASGHSVACLHHSTKI